MGNSNGLKSGIHSPDGRHTGCLSEISPQLVPLFKEDRGLKLYININFQMQNAIRGAAVFIHR